MANSEEVRQRTVNIDEFKDYVSDGTNRDFNNQVVYRFPNGYGASVIHGKGSYGLELLQIHFTYDDNDYFVHGTEQHTNLTKDELKNNLTKIKNMSDIK